jgi:hypothetical protein
MTLSALALTVALSALPYAAPRQLQPTKDTKSDTGAVLLVDTAKGEMKVTTAAGVVTFRIGPDVQAFDKDGKPAGAATAIAPATQVRVYYVLDGGPKVQEIDLQ